MVIFHSHASVLEGTHREISICLSAAEEAVDCLPLVGITMNQPFSILHGWLVMIQGFMVNPNPPRIFVIRTYSKNKLGDKQTVLQPHPIPNGSQPIMEGKVKVNS